ncbi:MAG TPA: HlyD family efflux transporter periplasmic adaptor subunit [Thermoanaerobaculia bacterium]|jgi:multidrug efflux pump subunit AcrA (membrane-fusion protein)
MNTSMLRHSFPAVVLLLLAGCFSGNASETAGSPPEMKARRGQFRNDLVLTGELEPARGESLTVPALPNWQTSIKWLAEDGSAVKEGEKVVELDNAALTNDLDAKRQTLTQALQELQQKEAEWSADLQEKQLEVERKLSEHNKAKLEAIVPADILASREYEERQTKLRRTSVEFDKTRDVLGSQKQAVKSERDNLLLRIEKARREISTAERAIEALVLRAPRDGIVVLRDIPWEGRKLQAGDTVWVGFPIALLPDLTSLRVAAALADVDDGRVAVGMRANITLDGYPSQPFTGRIESISAVAQESGRQSLRRLFKVIVAFDKLDPERMRPGLSARVVVDRGATATALLVPRAALDFSGKEPLAYLAGGEKKAVKVGACNAQECVVTSGLEEGERLAPVLEVKRG